MGEVSHIDPLRKEVIEVLEKALEDAKSGEIVGVVLLCHYTDNTTTSNWPGRFLFSTIIAALSIANTHFCNVVLSEGDDEEFD